MFDQNSTAAPTPDTNSPYYFTASTTLASNRTASTITLTLPTSAVSNLTQNPVFHESYFLFSSTSNLSSLDSTFPAGNYLFNVMAPASNQQVTVNLPASLVQPNTPHIANFTAAQSVDPAQSFVVGWDTFTSGTANDFISVSVGGVLQTPNLGTPGALTGTATSFTIPANTLQASSNYNVSIGFYRGVAVSNATYSTIAYVGSATLFNLITKGTSPTGPLVLTNGAFAGNLFTFDITCTNGQAVIVESSATLLPGSWTTLLTTNSTSTRVHVSDPHSPTNPNLF